jgi:hypothetical protein
MKVDCPEFTTCHEEIEGYTEKIQQDPRMLQSVVEHQDVPKEEAALILVGGLREWRRDWNMTLGCHYKLKGRVQVSCESQKRLTIAGRKMTHCARVAWCMENIRKDRTRHRVKGGTLKQQKDWEIPWKGPECNSGIRDRGLRQQLQGSMRIKNQGTRWQLCLKIERISDRIDRKAFRLEFVKRPHGMFSRMQEVKEWTICRDWHPQE